MLTALALLAAGLTISPGVATAEITYPWCAQYGESGNGGRNCGFATLAQCRAAISGNGGYCDENPMYRPAMVEPPVSRRSRR
jgi:hypothetical protein